MKTLVEKFEEAKRLASVIPERLGRAPVAIAESERLKVAPDAFFYRAHSSSGYVAGSSSEAYGRDPEAALDGLIAVLKKGVDEYLAELESGIARQMAEVRKARA